MIFVVFLLVILLVSGVGELLLMAIVLPFWLIVMTFWTFYMIVKAVVEPPTDWHAISSFEKLIDEKENERLLKNTKASVK